MYTHTYSVFFTFVDSRGLGLQPVKPAQVGQKFTVFNDENQEPVLPGQQGDWSDIPTRAVTNKENEKKAGVWTKAKVGNLLCKKIYLLMCNYSETKHLSIPSTKVSPSEVRFRQV